jgi:hypothetical protein
MRWQLFVDETGRFGDVESPVACVGLLLARDHPEAQEHRLRLSLGRIAPQLPWPFHAAHLNLPVYYALGRAAQAHPMDRVVLEGLRERAPELLGSVLDALARGRRPRYELVLQLDRLCAPHSRAYEELEKERARFRAAVLRHVRALTGAGPEGTEGTEGPGRVLLFCAAEASDAAAAPEIPDRFQVDSARYLALLETLLQRVVHVLARWPGGEVHDVGAQVLTRDVSDIARGTRRRMCAADIEAILDRLGDGSERVRVRVEAVPDFTAAVHPMMVVADFAANRSYGVLAQGRRGCLTEVETQLRSRAGGSVRSGTPPRSHVSSFTHPPAPPEAVQAFCWAVEQAAEWMP